MEDTKICPYCGEEIKAVAKKCWHCGKWLDKEPVPKIREQKSDAPKPIEPQTKHEEKPVVYTQTVNTTTPKPAARKDVAQFRLTFKQVLFIAIPIVAFIALLVSLILVHSNYSYGDWWEDEEIVILRLVLYFIGGLALYYAIVGAVLYYIKSAKKTNHFLSKYGEVSIATLLCTVLGIIGFIYAPGSKNTQEPDNSAYGTTTNDVGDAISIEESDPKALIKRHIEAIYSDVFSSPDANSESRYLISDFYNLYVKARDASGMTNLKEFVWCCSQSWNKMTPTINEIRLQPIPYVRLDLNGSNGETIKNVCLYLKDVNGEWRINDISYSGLSVKSGLQSLVDQSQPKNDDSDVDAEEIIREVTRNYTVIGKGNEYIFYLKGNKGRYEPMIYFQSLTTGMEMGADFKHIYDGSMIVEDYAFNNGKPTVIVGETDRNSTGFLEATLVVTLNPSTLDTKELSGGGCVKAEFNPGKTKVKMTFGDIVNPDAYCTADYEYRYSTKEVSL